MPSAPENDEEEQKRQEDENIEKQQAKLQFNQNQVKTNEEFVEDFYSYKFEGYEESVKEGKNEMKCDFCFKKDNSVLGLLTYMQTNKKIYVEGKWRKQGQIKVTSPCKKCFTGIMSGQPQSETPFDITGLFEGQIDGNFKFFGKLFDCFADELTKDQCEKIVKQSEIKQLQKPEQIQIDTSKPCGLIGGNVYFCNGLCKNSGSIWGDNPYTSDSNKCLAAKHSNARALNGYYLVSDKPGANSYNGSTKNNVTTQSYGTYESSFLLQPASYEDIELNKNLKNCGKIKANIYYCNGKCANSGSVWGSNPYTNDSNLCQASKHSGARNSTGYFQVIAKPGQSQYKGTQANGINTTDYGQFGGSVLLQSATQDDADKLQSIKDCGYLNKDVYYCNQLCSTGTVWGSNPYTSDSNKCSALKHSGLISNGQCKILPIEGLSSYEGTVKNSIQTKSYGPYSSSYIIRSVNSDSNTDNEIQSYCRKIKGNIFYCKGSCSNQGSIWGTNPYTSDSSVCLAAKHSGQRSTEGYFQTQAMPGQKSYSGSTKNGVTTKSYGSYGSSIQVKTATAQDVKNVQFLKDCGQINGNLWYCNRQCQSSGSVWGSNPYTSDSNKCRARYHSGCGNNDGYFILEAKPGQKSYQGTVKNNITTTSYGQYGSSYLIRDPKPEERTY